MTDTDIESSADDDSDDSDDRPTFVEASCAALTAVRKTRLNAQEIMGSDIRECEVVATICLTDDLKRDRLRNTRMVVTGDTLIFSEYEYQNEFGLFFYTYVTPHYRADLPSLYVIEPPLKKPNSGVLFKRRSGGATREICRWDD